MRRLTNIYTWQDMFLGPAWTITAGISFNLVGLVILMVWFVPEAALWFAFAISYAAYGMSPVFHGWVNNQLRVSNVAGSLGLPPSETRTDRHPRFSGLSVRASLYAGHDQRHGPVDHCLDAALGVPHSRGTAICERLCFLLCLWRRGDHHEPGPGGLQPQTPVRSGRIHEFQASLTTFFQ